MQISLECMQNVPKFSRMNAEFFRTHAECLCSRMHAESTRMHAEYSKMHAECAKIRLAITTIEGPRTTVRLLSIWPQRLSRTPYLTPFTIPLDQASRPGVSVDIPTLAPQS